jgi:hypothetical protein
MGAIEALLLLDVLFDLVRSKNLGNVDIRLICFRGTLAAFLIE